jgi:NodT family efflux transporter outer membrane factor (OMF) lipoprotein
MPSIEVTAMRRSLLVLLLATSALAGCTVGTDYRRPSVALTDRYRSQVAIAPATAAPWWTAFGDPLIDRLVEEALAQNLDLAATAARLDQARAAARAAGAALLPQGELAMSATRQRQSLRTPVGAVSDRLDLPRNYSLYEIAPRASWEIDLFGGLRRERQAARADLASADAEAQAVRLSVAAETVDAYLQLRGLQARLDIAGRQLRNEKELAGLIGSQAAQGIVADRALQRVLGEQYGLDAALAPLRAAIVGQMNRIDVLTGRQAGDQRALLAPVAAIPSAPDPSGSSAPAELMRRRPDIVAAERRVAAANARIGAAIADYYPRLSLSGLFSVASVGAAGLFTGTSVQAGATAGLRWRLFDFGRVDAEVAQARGREAEALAFFRRAVLRGTADVEDALVGLAEGRSEIAAREQEVAFLTRSRDQALQGYRGGVLALIDVLDADRALLGASDRLASARAETARSSVAAIRALGGGWGGEEASDD